MAPKKAKPELVKIGNHYVNVADISCISAVKVRDEDDQYETRKTMYVVRFISNPNPEYTCWVEKKDIGFLLEQFNIKVE